MSRAQRAPLRGPRIVRTPPGPKSRAAMAAKERHVTNGVRVGLPIDVVRANGPYVQDADGNVYVDFTTGIGVQNFGRGPPAAARAAQNQLDALTHISFMVALYEPYIDLAKAMAKIAPRGLSKSIFLNSGSEAIENAVNASLDRIEREIKAPDVGGNVAAILAEPVQGEGGIIVPPKEFFPALRKLCDPHGIVFIDDEVQAGM